MKKAVVKIPAKINLTLDVISSGKDFHQIKTLVASIGIYDVIKVKARKDKKVTLKTKGIDPMCKEQDNNAYKAAVEFIKEYKVNGVDITLNKGIPVGAGLGGSSADIAGVLIGMQKLYGQSYNVQEIASRLGSDVNYMLKGGYALVSGRGERVESKDFDKTFHLIVLTEKAGVSAKDCYCIFDQIGKTYPPCTDNAVKHFADGYYDILFWEIKNDLYNGAKKLLPKIEENVNALKGAGAKAVVMTGSGSAVVGIFLTAKERDKVAKKLIKEYGENLIKTKTI